MRVLDGREQQLLGTSSSRPALVDVELRYTDGSKEPWLIPVCVGEGKISDAFASPAFRTAALAKAISGDHFYEPGQLTQGKKKPVRTDAKTRATVTALARAICGGKKNEWHALTGAPYNITPERFEHVVATAKMLSPENADAIVAKFFENVRKTLDAQSTEVRDFHQANATRPTFSPVFYGYAQFMGVPDGKQNATFEDLKNFLNIIAEPTESALTSTIPGLGFRELEILPFFDSPLRDGGYDISDHAKVMDALGGNKKYEEFMAEAVGRGIRVTADLVANHVSNEHPWVKGLEAGDESMLSRFVVWDGAVKIGEGQEGDTKYNYFLHMKGSEAGLLSRVVQIFPENNPDTFIETSSNGVKHNVFATFMNPYQWDVNVADPEVFNDFLQTLGYYHNQGQTVTRLDAITHAGKKPGSNNYNLDQSLAFAALVKAFTSIVAPGSKILPEAFLDWETARTQWLDPQANFGNQSENVVSDALISFSTHAAIWETLLKEDKRSWIKVQEMLGALRPDQSVLTYLGLHDETYIGDPELRKSLIETGATDFGGRAVGDSPAKLLGGNADRLAMAHVLLYSGKGHPAVYYRTVVGADNDEAHFNEKMDERLKAQAGDAPDPVKARDARDLDRGPIAFAEYKRKLTQGYKPAITVRALNLLWETHGAIRTNDIKEVPNPDQGIVSYTRRATDIRDTDTSSRPLLQLVNLTGEKKTVKLQMSDLADRLGWRTDSAPPENLVDVLRAEIQGGGDASVPFQFDEAEKTISIALKPYDALFLESRQDD